MKDFKFRFMQILEYIHSDACLKAVRAINALPDQAEHGYHDAYLKAQLITIILDTVRKEDFAKFSTVHKVMFNALFICEIEEKREESINNCFLKAESKEQLDSYLTALIGQPYKDEDQYLADLCRADALRDSCEKFIDFYKNNVSSIEKNLATFSHQLLIDNAPEELEEPEEDMEGTVFLDNQGEESCITQNESLVISNMRPCLGGATVGENEEGELSCIGEHISSSVCMTESGYIDLFSNFEVTHQNIKEKGYKNNCATFLTGANMDTFSLALELVMHDFVTAWANQSSPLINNIYLLPSPQGCWSHCIVNLHEGCEIIVGAQVGHKKDIAMKMQLPILNQNSASFFQPVLKRGLDEAPDSSTETKRLRTSSFPTDPST